MKECENPSVFLRTETSQKNLKKWGKKSSTHIAERQNRMTIGKYVDVQLINLLLMMNWNVLSYCSRLSDQITSRKSKVISLTLFIRSCIYY